MPGLIGRIVSGRGAARAAVRAARPPDRPARFLGVLVILSSYLCQKTLPRSVLKRRGPATRSKTAARANGTVYEAN